MGRKWIQFRLRSMMLIPVVVGGVWWWHTWPERTARRFHQYLAEGNVEAARQMIAISTENQLDANLRRIAKRGEWQFTLPRIHARTLAEWFAAQGEFNIAADQQSRRLYFGRFVASRGSVKPKEQTEKPFGVSYSLGSIDPKVAIDKIRGEVQSDSQGGIVVDSERNSLLLVAPKVSHDSISAVLEKLHSQSTKESAVAAAE